MSTIQKRNKQRGRAVERAIAKLFGGTSIGVLGGEDIMTDEFSIEVKSRAKFVGESWYNQCVNNNKRNKIPLVVIHLKGKQYNKSFVMLNIEDFLKLIKRRK